MSGALRLLGGNSSLNTVVSDMNTNILRLQPIVKGNFTKVAKSGTTSGTAATGSVVIITVPHGLTYIPQAVVYGKPPGNFRYIPAPVLEISVGSGVGTNSVVYIDVDATNLHINMCLGTASLWGGVWNFKYDLLSSTAN